AIAAQRGELPVVHSNHFPAFPKHDPVVTEPEPLASLLKLTDESVVGLAGNVEPEAFDAQGAQAGQVMQIQPLHPAAFGIAGTPTTGDDDFFHVRYRPRDPTRRRVR